MLNDSLGNHTYYATAADSYGNIGRDPATGYKTFIVSQFAVVQKAGIQKTPIQKTQVAVRSPYEIPADEPPGGVIDTTPPAVYVLNSPLYPVSGQQVWIIANATDDTGLRSVLVYLDGWNIAQCYPSSRFVSCQAAALNLSVGNHTYYAVANVRTCASSPCIYSRYGIYAGNHTYYATATDTSGNVGRNPPAGYKTFTIGSASRTIIIREARMPNSILDPISSFLNKFAEKLS